jgi:hypothetical protein
MEELSPFNPFLPATNSGAGDQLWMNTTRVGDNAQEVMLVADGAA